MFIEKYIFIKAVVRNQKVRVLLCDIFLVLVQNTLLPLLQSILVFVCLMEQERGEGGAAPHIFKHHFHIFSFIEGGRNYSLCLSPSSTFQELL